MDIDFARDFIFMPSSAKYLEDYIVYLTGKKAFVIKVSYQL